MHAFYVERLLKFSSSALLPDFGILAYLVSPQHIEDLNDARQKAGISIENQTRPKSAICV